ncbi:MAG: hypothetical protein EOP67_08050 [Sphingomonas sp.]|nr:MAG: hypothetical protein EOP67_08050 [Sphingomonas sp.]
MSKPMLLADFVRLPPTVRGSVVEGLAAAIDSVAERGAPSHRFLRFGWYAAALAAYGGQARTLVVEQDDVPVLTLPFVPLGPRVLRMAEIPGCCWPFRSFGVAFEASDAALKTALSMLAGHVNGLRIGPVHDTDPAATALIVAARAKGWTAIDRTGTPGTRDGHPAFWEVVVADPVIAGMFRHSGDSGDGEGIGAAVDAPIRDWLLFRPGLPALAGRLFGWVWRRSATS